MVFLNKLNIFFPALLGLLPSFAIPSVLTPLKTDLPPLFNQMVVFGDSLSDQGAEKGRNDRYLAGGFALPNYVELLSDLVSFTLTLPKTLGGTNYAQASAHTLETDRNTKEQVAHYLKDVHGQIDPNLLIIYHIGGNDMSVSKILQQAPTYYLTTRLLHRTFSLRGKIPGPEAIVTQINLLYDHGSQHFLVPNLWHMSFFPYLSYQIPVTTLPFFIYRTFKPHGFDSMVALLLFNSWDQKVRQDPYFNGGNDLKEKELNLLHQQLPFIPSTWLVYIKSALEELADAYGQAYFEAAKEGLEQSKANILYADVAKLYDEIYQDPKSFGIDNVLLPACNLGVSSSTLFCDGPYLHRDRTYLWSDWFHPSSDADALLAAYYLSLLDAPFYPSSLTQEFISLNQGNQRFLSDRLKNWRLNEQAQKNGRVHIFAALSSFHRQEKNILATYSISAPLIHLGEYYYFNPHHLLGFHLSFSHHHSHPFPHFHFHYLYVGMNFFHQYSKNRFWIHEFLSLERLHATRVYRRIPLGKLNRVAIADNVFGLHLGLNTTLGYDILHSPEKVAGLSLGGAFDHYHIKAYEEKGNLSTSMRFAKNEISVPQGKISFYYQLKDLPSRPWSWQTSISYQKSPKRSLHLGANVKNFSRNYQTKLDISAVSGWEWAASWRYKLPSKGKIGTDFHYFQGRHKSHSWDLALSYQQAL